MSSPGSVPSAASAAASAAPAPAASACSAAGRAAAWRPCWPARSGRRRRRRRRWPSRWPGGRTSGSPRARPGVRGTRTAVSSSSGSRRSRRTRRRSRPPATLRRPARALQLHRAAERDQRHRQVGRWVGVRERAADRAAVADLRVADLRGGRGRAAARRPGPGRRRPASACRVAAPITSSSPSMRDAGQLGQPADVDEHRRGGQPQLHHRQQRVAAGQQLGVVAVLGQQVQRVRRPTRPARSRTAPGSLRSPPAGLGMSAAASTARTMLW